MKRKKKSFQEHGLRVKSLMTVVLCEGLVMLVHGVSGGGGGGGGGQTFHSVERIQARIQA